MDSEHAPELAEEIRRLQDAYEMYRTTMFKILDVGRPGVTALINALRDRITDPIAVALGCAFGRDTPGAEEAVLPLLVFMQRTDRSYGFVVEALARAGEKCVPHLRDELHRAAATNDDGWIRGLLDVAHKLSRRAIAIGAEALMPEVVSLIVGLLPHENRDVRENAIDTLGAIGIPYACVAKAQLKEMQREDPDQEVRKSALEALVLLGA